MKKMRNEPFIIRFLKASVNPAGVCRYRNTFSWPHISFLFIFLTACLLAPLSISFMKTDHFNVRAFMPSAIQEVDETFADQIDGYQFTNGKLTGGKGFYQVEKGRTLLAVDMKQQFKTSGDNGNLKVKGYHNAIIFQPDHLIISDQNGTGFSVRYANTDAGLKGLDAHDLEVFIGTLWFAQYKPMMMVLAYAGIFIIQLFLTAAFAGGIWITKISKMTRFASFKEAASMAICGSALPVFAAAIAGMVHFDFITVLLIYSCGVALMISFTFRYVTQTRHYNGNLQFGGNHDKSAAF